ncbi:MAG: hypothetical protein ACUVS4_06600, partial [Chloroflexaceae bacterium]
MAGYPKIALAPHLSADELKLRTPEDAASPQAAPPADAGPHQPASEAPADAGPHQPASEAPADAG